MGRQTIEHAANERSVLGPEKERDEAVGQVNTTLESSEDSAEYLQLNATISQIGRAHV